MAITEYVVNGETRYQVYLNLRSKHDPTVRFQKRVRGLKSKLAATKEEKKQTRILLERIQKREGVGLDWEVVLRRWELYHRDESNHDRLSPSVVDSYLSLVNKWTKTIFKTPVSLISRADIRDIFKDMESKGRSKTYQQKLKRVSNQIFNWALDERIVQDTLASPFRNYTFGKVAEQIPEILSMADIKKLLRKAKEVNHEWYPIWAAAAMTGMRSGELCALTWNSIDLEKNIIFIHKNYISKERKIGQTKGRYWRTVPISTELKEFLIELKSKTEGGYLCSYFPDEGSFVFPRFKDWYSGHQLDPLKTFCSSIGMKKIKFHTLRACFGIHLLNLGVSQAIVMKIAGWKELKTMERYIRLAGVEIQGTTEALKVLPNNLDSSDTTNVVNLFNPNSLNF